MILAPIVIDLGVILMFLVAFALCLLSKQIVKALFQVGESLVGWIPWLGSRISGDLHRIEQRLTNYLGVVAVALQHGVGALWHALASLMEQLAATIENNSRLLWQIAQYLPGLATIEQVAALIKALVKQLHVTRAQVHSITAALPREAKATTHAIHTADHALIRAQAIPADVLLPRDLLGLRGRVRSVEDELSSLWSRVRGLNRSTLEGLGVAAIAVALGRLGVTWARCSNVGKAGRNICGMDANLLESLLADSLLIVGTLSLVEFANEMVGVTETAVRPITTFWRAN